MYLFFLNWSIVYFWASLVAQMVKNLPAMRETWDRSLGWKDPLEEGLATHSSILPWRIPWPEEPGGLQSMGLQKIGHSWATACWVILFCCCSVTKSCPTFCDLVDCSTPCFLVLHYLTEFAQTCVCLLSQWCHQTISSSVVPFSFCPQSFPASGSFPMSQLFASCGQIIRASASASVLPINIQGWFLLGLTLE